MTKHHAINAQLAELAATYAADLAQKTATRLAEMADDDLSHLLIYRVLGVSTAEGQQIDLYQNKGRFLYNAAGRFLQEATKLCFQQQYPDATSHRIPNSHGRRPRTFEIDCLIGQEAIEIKWRDATTDGDHITKEHTRLQAIVTAGYTPIRLMYYQPNRTQAHRIQQTLATLYTGVGGEYYAGEAAWQFVQTRTGIPLHQLLQQLADTTTGESSHA
jgi:hypothetical protein